MTYKNTISIKFGQILRYTLVFKQLNALMMGWSNGRMYQIQMMDYNKELLRYFKNEANGIEIMGNGKFSQVTHNHTFTHTHTHTNAHTSHIHTHATHTHIQIVALEIIKTD